MGLFRRRRDEDDDPLAALRGDDPLAALRGDGALTSIGTPAPEAAPAGARSDRAPRGAGRAPGRIVARRDTGVLVAGRPRAQLTFEIRPAKGAPFTLAANVVVGEGTAAEIGDIADVAYDDGRLIDVRLRPAIRPAPRRS